MTHKQWFNNVLHLHPVHEEGAEKTALICTQVLPASPKRHR